MASIKIGAANLGRCEHCSTPVSVEICLSLKRDLICPTCKRRITAKSFGFEMVDGASKKTRWVNETGEWSDKKPLKNFILPFFGWEVIVNKAKGPIVPPGNYFSTDCKLLDEEWRTEDPAATE